LRGERGQERGNRQCDGSDKGHGRSSLARKNKDRASSPEGTNRRFGASGASQSVKISFDSTVESAFRR